MTPQGLEAREEHVEERISTSDLVAAAGSNNEKTKTAEHNVPLFAANEAQDLRSRWEKIQIGFVDEPRKAVEQADELVASAIKRLAEVFASERNKLEADWDKTDNVSTEDLRVALRRYRSFFDRLLSL
jgi:hypothetical protein